MEVNTTTSMVEVDDDFKVVLAPSRLATEVDLPERSAVIKPPYKVMKGTPRDIDPLREQLQQEAR